MSEPVEFPVKEAATYGGAGIALAVLTTLLGVWFGKTGFFLIIAGVWILFCLVCVGVLTINFLIDRNAQQRKNRRQRDEEAQHKDEKLEPYREGVRRFVYDLIDEYRWLLETPWEHQKKWADHPGEVTTESGKVIESGGGYLEIIEKWKDLMGRFNDLRKRREFAAVLDEVDEDLKRHSATRLPHGGGVMDLWEAQMKLYRYARAESDRLARQRVDIEERVAIRELRLETKDRARERERERKSGGLPTAVRESSGNPGTTPQAAPQVEEFTRAAVTVEPTVIAHGVPIILDLHLHLDMFPKHWQWTAVPLPPEQWGQAVTLARQALAKYPPALLKSNLTGVCCVGKLLDKDGESAGGVAASSEKRIYIASQREQTFHHELAHVFRHHHQEHLPDVEWRAVNPEGFEYGTEQFKGLDEDKLWEQGFMSRNATTSLEEDFCETVARLFVFLRERTLVIGPRYRVTNKLWFRAERSERLTKKLRLAVQFFNRLDPQCTEEYFR